MSKNRRYPKIEMHYNMQEQVKNMISDKLKKFDGDLWKTRWPFNKHKKIISQPDYYIQDEITENNLDLNNLINNNFIISSKYFKRSASDKNQISDDYNITNTLEESKFNNISIGSLIESILNNEINSHNSEIYTTEKANIFVNHTYNITTEEYKTNDSEINDYLHKNIDNFVSTEVTTLTENNFEYINTVQNDNYDNNFDFVIKYTANTYIEDITNKESCLPKINTEYNPNNEIAEFTTNVPFDNNNSQSSIDQMNIEDELVYNVSTVKYNISNVSNTIKNSYKTSTLSDKQMEINTILQKLVHKKQKQNVRSIFKKGYRSS